MAEANSGGALTASPRAKRAKPTHCKHGHPYDETNPPYVKPNGWWNCRECGRQRTRRYLQANPKPLKGRYRNPWSEWVGSGGYFHVCLPPDEVAKHPTARQNGSKNSWRIVRSHLAWNLAHPEDPARPGDEIHHINGLKQDDRPVNLAKLGKSQHRALHVTERRRILKLEAELAEYRKRYGPLET